MADPNRCPTNGSFNRSKSKPPQAPLTIPPGHVAFRMLCHASRIGGVIGKSGAIIKNLQQLTGAKIRVEDAPPDTPDRIVVIIAPSAINSKVYLGKPSEGNGYAGNGGGAGAIDDCGVVEVSKAQEALLKVFERVLDVAAETDGTEVRDGVVSCRLLAGSPQVGSVIGKGGKVVEKIRKDTGCKIRALSNCVRGLTTSEETIEIEGNVSSVKKALLAVSHRLQDCTPADRTKVMDSKSYESAVVIPHEPLTDQHADYLLQKNPPLPAASDSSNSYSSGFHSLLGDFNRASSLDSKALQEVTFRILCPGDRVGIVIGKGGSVVKNLQNESGASIMVGPPVANCDERVITMTASENPEARYSPAQKATVLVFSKFVETGKENGYDPGSNKGPHVTARILVPTNQVGCLLGKGGAIVSEMRKATGTGIRVIRTDQVPKCALDNDQVVQISGVFSNVQDALYNATGRLRDNLFASTQNVAGTRNNSAVLHDTSPYARPGDYAPLGGQPGVGASHNQSIHTFSQSIDHSRLPQNSNCPPSSGLWTSEMVSRDVDDVGRKLSSLTCGLEVSSGSKAAVVTSTTVEIKVTDDVFDSVYGEGGSNLTRLRQISGATVTIHDPHPGTKERIIVMSGTPDQTQAAQSLLQAFIITGSS